MNPLAERLAVVAIALVLDLAIGDPQYRLHPVRLLGSAIRAAEGALRRTGLPERFAGVLLALGVTSLAAATALAASLAAHALLPSTGAIVVDALVVYFTLAGRALADEGRAVRDTLASGDLLGARSRLAGLVGRDTHDLSEQEIARATIETVGENTVDALVAPVFWSLALGPAGAWMHKAASTLDSMVGYRNERYARFGTAGALLDDALAFLPARIAIGLIALAAALVRLSPAAAMRIGVRDRLAHPSPNSAHGEAAFAGALGVSLGGGARYQGVLSPRPEIAPELRVPTASDVSRAIALLFAVEVLLATGLAATSLLLAVSL